MRFKVPQNIDIEDRILGPLTMVQFIYAVVGGGFCYALLMALPKPLSYVIICPIVLFVLGLVFMKVNERPFLNFVISVFEFLSSPKQRIWRHENLSDLDIEIYKVEERQKTVTNEKHLTHKDFSEIAKHLDEN